MFTDKINLSLIQTQTNYLKTIAPTPLRLINNTRDASAMWGGQVLLQVGKGHLPASFSFRATQKPTTGYFLWRLLLKLDFFFFFLKTYKSKCINAALWIGKARRYIAVGEHWLQSASCQMHTCLTLLIAWFNHFDAIYLVWVRLSVLSS